MLIRLRGPSEVRPSEITPRSVYLNRRHFLAGGAAIGAAAVLGAGPSSAETLPGGAAAPANALPNTLPDIAPSSFSTTEEKTPLEAIIRYNNFYEFGTDKEDPYMYAAKLKTRPWAVVVDGLCAKPGTFDIDQLIRTSALEERVYRLRCVEAWSMVIPWAGFPLSSLLARAEPLGSAKFVAFQTLLDPGQMPGQRRSVLEWPYVEGLRLDEANHPLTIAAVGLYGAPLPNQDGAPIRVVVPWKYGFKSIKSIVRVTLTEQMPPTSWNVEAPREYGFYSNVNPAVDHPRWSQKRERRIGELLRRETLPFNGYADQVASLYAGMDLVKWF